MGEDILDMEPKGPETACEHDNTQEGRGEGADDMIVNVAFPFTLATPPFGPSRPYIADHAAKIAYVKAVETELASLDEELRARPVAAVRLSGGASIMNADSVCHLVRSIRKALTLEPHAEISIDVEPITVCTPSLTDWTSCGINRVNLAAVSVHDDELRAMGAAHTREQLQNALLFLGKFHMSRVSIELMYGLPRQTRASWEHTLLTVADLGYPHIRVTPLVDRHTGGAANAEVANADTTNAEVTSEQNRAASLPSIEDRRSWYELACTTLTSRGYEQYAVDSFVSTSAPHGRDRFDKHARNGADVLGLGAGAHSRIDGFAYANAVDFDLYVQHSAEFETIVRNPARIDTEAQKEALARQSFENLSMRERFEQAEALGSVHAR